MARRTVVRLERKRRWMRNSAEYGAETQSMRSVPDITSRFGVDGKLSSWVPGPLSCWVFSADQARDWRSWRFRGTDPMAGQKQVRAMGKQPTAASLGRILIGQ